MAHRILGFELAQRFASTAPFRLRSAWESGACQRSVGSSGIVIKMFFNDHEPSHFHAVYGDDEALIEIETFAVYRGHLPRRALALVLEWATVHRAELRRDWELARSGEPVDPIDPLE